MSIPDELCAHPSLLYLRLQDNRITKIPEMFAKSKVQELNLCSNLIEVIPDFFEKTKIYSAKLNLANNPIKQVANFEKIKTKLTESTIETLSQAGLLPGSS